MESHRKYLETFTLEDLPDLDTAVLGALELFAEKPLPKPDLARFARPLVAGSGNAAVIGRVLFSGTDAVFADESTYTQVLASTAVDGGVIISASGGKHAVVLARGLAERDLPALLLTNNPDAPARAFLDDGAVSVFPKNREPYTYNTSTYMGMMLAKTNEDPSAIHAFITKEVAPSIPDTLDAYDAFFLIVPEECDVLRAMFLTKFDELFGSMIHGRSFTLEQTKHARTVVPNEKELFISFGVENGLFGTPQRRLHIPLPENAGPVAMFAIGYYVIGQIQKQKPPYFKEAIAEYTQQASEIFGQEIQPIVT